jgi:hypothetical protein
MAMTSPNNDPGPEAHVSTGLEDLVRSEIGDLTTEFRRTVDRVGDRINLMVQAELQRALADVLTGNVSPRPEPPLQSPVNGTSNGHVEASRPNASTGPAASTGDIGLHEVIAPQPELEVLPEPKMLPAIPASASVVDTASPTNDEAEGRSYEGVVKLQVRASGCTCQSTQFVRAVSRMPELRVLRLVGSAGTGLELLVGLRQPMPLERVLSDMDRVASVRPTQASVNRDEDGTGEQELAVWLVDAPSSAPSSTLSSTHLASHGA